MSEKARRKRLMRLRGEKRAELDKPAGMAGYMIPGIDLDALTEQLVMQDPGGSLIDEDDPFMGRFEMSDDNIENAGDGLEQMRRIARRPPTPKPDYAAAGEWLRGFDNYGRERDRGEAEPPHNPGTGVGDELEGGEVQSGTGNHKTLAEEGSTAAETPDDQC